MHMRARRAVVSVRGAKQRDGAGGSNEREERREGLLTESFRWANVWIAVTRTGAGINRGLQGVERVQYKLYKGV